MVTSSILLEAKTTAVEKRGVERRVKGIRIRLRGGKPLEAHLAAHLCATQWLKGCLPPRGGLLLEAHWGYVCRDGSLF